MAHFPVYFDEMGAKNNDLRKISSCTFKVVRIPVTGQFNKGGT